MTVEEMKWFATLGVGGVLAGITFYFYRLDRMASEAALKQVNEQSRKISDELLEVVKQNTRAVQSLTETIRGRVQEGKKTRPRNRKSSAA